MEKESHSEDTTEPSEAATEKGSEEPIEEPEKEPTKTPKICSVCGATVVPEEISTERGTRYRCPKCHKFMRPLTQSEALAHEETTMASDVIRPPEVVMVDRIRELLRERLPKIYGLPISQKKEVINAIVETVSFANARDPLLLHAHIKSFAKSVNERHLETIITSIYDTLGEEGYGVGEERYTPSYRSLRTEGGIGQPMYSGLRQNLGIAEGEREVEKSSTSGIKVVVDGQVMVTDAAGFMAWKEYEIRRKEAEERSREHELQMKKLEAEILKVTTEAKGGGGDQTVVEVPIGEGKTIKVPANLAPFYLRNDDELRRKLEEEKEARHQVEMRIFSDKVGELSAQIQNQPSFIDQWKQIRGVGEEMGLKPGGKTTVDLLDEGLKGLNQNISKIVEKISPGGDFQPQVTRTPEERKKKAEELKGRLNASEELLQAEDALLDAARKAQSSD